MALQLGCLEMRRHFKDLSPQALNKKSNLNMLENVSPKVWPVSYLVLKEFRGSDLDCDML